MQCIHIINLIIYRQILSQKAVRAIPANNDSWDTSRFAWWYKTVI